jgi:hypothetical protein
MSSPWSLTCFSGDWPSTGPRDIAHKLVEIRTAREKTGGF